MSDSVQEVVDIFADYLKKNGLKMTRQRRIILDSFLRTGGHVSTEELHQLAKKEDERLGFVTVFRTLKALSDCGIARKIDLDDGRARFEHNYKRTHHHHVVCIDCSNTIEFVSPEQEHLQEEITSKYGFKAVRHTLQIFGICPKCQKNEEPNRESYNAELVFARDALKIAMATEQRGISFYQAASEMVTQASTREVFLSMLSEEEDHLSKLEKEWDRLIKGDRYLLEAPIFLHFDYKALAQIFPHQSEVRAKMKDSIDAAEALKMAMKMEMEAHDFFANYAESFDDTKGRDIFLEFADEEKEHYDIIKEEYDRMVKSGEL